MQELVNITFYSLQSITCVLCCLAGPQTLARLVQNPPLQLRKDGCNSLTVNTEELSCDSNVLFKSSDFCVDHPLRICFQGEADVDAGGIR